MDSTLTGAVSARELRALLNAAHDAVVAIDVTGRICEWNDAASTVFGWTRQEVVGTGLADRLIPERYRAAHEEGFARCVATGHGRVLGKRLEVEARHRDGREVPIELTVSVVSVRGERHFFAVLHDISGRREAEGHRRRLEALLDSTEDAVLWCSAAGVVVRGNARAERLLGVAPAGRALGDLGFEDDVVTPALRGDDPVALMSTVTDAEGEVIDVTVTAAGHATVDDEVRLLVTVRDISPWRTAQARLLQTQTMLADAFDAAPTGVAILDPQGRFVAVNPALCEFLQRTEAELHVWDLAGLTMAEDEAAQREALAPLLDGRTDAATVASRLVAPAGGALPCRLTLTAERDLETGEVVSLVAQVHRAERAARLPLHRRRPT